MIDEAILELAPLIGTRAACRATGRAQASHYRRHRQNPPPARPVRQRRAQPRALSAAERDTVRALLNSPGFMDKAPATVYHELLDEGIYVASISSMYRILRSHGEVRERRRQAVHPARVKPELVATAPNQCWSWDITKLHGPTKWSYFHLYVIIDIYSRYTVGWLLADRESAALAEQLLADSVAKQGIDRDRLTIHADNGSSMASKPVAFLLADLGVTKSHSRPHTSRLPKTVALPEPGPMPIWIAAVLMFTGSLVAALVKARSHLLALYLWHKTGDLNVLREVARFERRTREQTTSSPPGIDRGGSARPISFSGGLWTADCGRMAGFPFLPRIGSPCRTPGCFPACQREMCEGGKELSP